MFNTVCFKSGRQYSIAGESSAEQLLTGEAQRCKFGACFASATEKRDHFHSHPGSPCTLKGCIFAVLLPTLWGQHVTTVTSQQLPLGLQKNLLQMRPTPCLSTKGKLLKHTTSAHAEEKDFPQKRSTFPQKSVVACTRHLLLAPLHFQLLNNHSKFCYVYITHSPNFLLPGKSLLQLPKGNLQSQCVEECKPRPLIEAHLLSPG